MTTENTRLLDGTYVLTTPDYYGTRIRNDTLQSVGGNGVSIGSGTSIGDIGHVNIPAATPFTTSSTWSGSTTSRISSSSGSDSGAPVYIPRGRYIVIGTPRPPPPSFIERITPFHAIAVAVCVGIVTHIAMRPEAKPFWATIQNTLMPNQNTDAVPPPLTIQRSPREKPPKTYASNAANTSGTSGAVDSMPAPPNYTAVPTAPPAADIAAAAEEILSPDVPIRFPEGSRASPYSVADGQGTLFQAYAVVPPGQPTDTVLGDSTAFKGCNETVVPDSNPSRTVLGGGSCLGHRFSSVDVPDPTAERCTISYPNTETISVDNCNADGVPVRNIIFTRRGYPNSQTYVYVPFRNGR